MAETHEQWSQRLAVAFVEALNRHTLAEKPAPTVADLERQEQTRKSWKFAARMANAIVAAEKKLPTAKDPDEK